MPPSTAAALDLTLHEVAHIPADSAPALDALDPRKPTPRRWSRASVSLPGLCRWLGTLSVVTAACLYMLHGLEHITEEARAWSYLLFAFVLCAAGVVSQRALRDPKGARLLLFLAALMVPVQFSQLGGMLHELSTANPGWSSLLPRDLAGLSAERLIGTSAATFLLTPLVAFAGFAVLARPDALRLSAIFLTLTAALLIPARASTVGFGVVGTLALIALALELKWFRRATYFQTPEGLAARVLLVSPFLIAALRLAFHVQNPQQFAALTGSVGLALTVTAPAWGAFRVPAHLQRIVGLTVMAVAWVGYTDHAVDFPSGAVHVAALLAPLGIAVFATGAVSPGSGRSYENVGFVLLALGLLPLAGTASTLVEYVACISGAGALIYWGFNARAPVATLAGFLLALAFLSTLGWSAMRHIEVNLWWTLGFLGIAAILFGSTWERYAPALRRHLSRRSCEESEC